MKAKSQRLSYALDRLAALFEYGALQAATDPSAFIDRVCGEVVRLRALGPSPPPSGEGPLVCANPYCPHERAPAPPAPTPTGGT